jgi:hypothetical protein
MKVAAEWGSIPSWLALVGALVAAAAFVVGRLDALRRPASMVFPIAMSYKYGGDPDSPDPDTHTTVQIENGSDMPVFECHIALYKWGHRRRFWRLRRYDRWMTGERIVGRVYPTLLAHHNSSEDELPGLGLPISKGTIDRNMSPPLLLLFRDGNGRRWIRWPDGRLTRHRPCRPSALKNW